MPVKNKKVRLAPLAVLAAALVLHACSKPDAATQQSPQLPKVGVVVVEPAPVTLTTELPGRTAAYLIADVRPQVSGIVKKRLFNEGSEVAEGELLYEIDPATYRAAHESARAALARAEANVVSARLKAKRYEELSRIDAISKQAHDDAVAELKQAEADIAAGKASVTRARIDVDYTQVKSPIPGRIGRSTVTAGALVTANQEQVLATVQQLDPIYVDLTQSSSEMMRLRRALENGRIQRTNGDRTPVSLVLDDGSQYEHAGELAFSEVSVDPGTGSVTLRAVFPNPEQRLLPGMYVRAVLEQGVNREAITVPHQAISRDARGMPLAMVVGPDDKIEARPLTIERALGDSWLVNDGLQAGDRVVVEGLQMIRPGAQVSVTEAPTAEAPAASGSR